ncbi:MAG: hypothetical protein RBR22_10675 [Desulfuromonas sp.]|nr:hypothetical protein [Desulfuromonas sp.]
MPQTVDDQHNKTIDSNLVTRLKQALTSEGELLAALMHDQNTEVLHAALRNIALTPEHLLQLLKREDINPDLLRAISQHKLSQKHNITIALVRHPAISPTIVKQLLQRLHLFELLNLCTLPGQTTDIKMAAEQGIIQRLPQEPLGNKITLARRASSSLLFPLIKEGQQQVIEASLENPRLKEAALFQFISSGNSSPQTISMIARHPRWSKRKNLQRAILKNRHTPQIWYTQFLPQISIQEIRNLLFSSSLSTNQKGWIQEHLDKRYS